MKLSIAMATYNGEAYLREQLDSFVSQTRQPDELVVSDDCSTDNTASILQEFAERAPFPVRVIRNSYPLGVRGNFNKALESSDGDCIFLSDQDDVWLPNKINDMVLFGEANNWPLLVVCDTRFGNSDLTQLGNAKLPYVRRVKGRVDGSHIMGCCTMITKEFAELALPIPDIPGNHDNWLHGFAERLGGRRIMEEVLQYYRRHGANDSQGVMSDENVNGRLSYLVGHVRHQSMDAINARAQMLQAMRTRLTEERNVASNINLKAAINAIEHENEAVSKRLTLVGMKRGRRIPTSVRMLLAGDYWYFKGVASWAKDLLRPSEKKSMNAAKAQE